MSDLSPDRAVYIFRSTNKELLDTKFNISGGVRGGTLKNYDTSPVLIKFKQSTDGQLYKIKKNADFEALFNKIHVEGAKNSKCYIAQYTDKTVKPLNSSRAEPLRKLCSNAVHAGPFPFGDFEISSIDDLKNRANKIVYISDVFDYKIEGKKKSKKKKKKMINSYFETFLAEVYG
eukprot:841088_1